MIVNAAEVHIHLLDNPPTGAERFLDTVDDRLQWFLHAPAFFFQEQTDFPYHHARDACSDLAVLGMALPAVFAEVGNLLLQAFTDDGVPTWEISKKTGERGEWNVVAKGTADSFEAPKRRRSSKREHHREDHNLHRGAVGVAARSTYCVRLA